MHVAFHLLAFAFAVLWPNFQQSGRVDHSSRKPRSSVVTTWMSDPLRDTTTGSTRLCSRPKISPEQNVGMYIKQK